MILKLLRKFHTYTALLTFINLAVYGVVGLSITFLRQSGSTAQVVSYQSFTSPPNLTDRQVAERICSLLHLSLATPVNGEVIQHDAANNLLLDLRHLLQGGFGRGRPGRSFVPVHVDACQTMEAQVRTDNDRNQ